MAYGDIYDDAVGDADMLLDEAIDDYVGASPMFRKLGFSGAGSSRTRPAPRGSRSPRDRAMAGRGPRERAPVPRVAPEGYAPDWAALEAQYYEQKKLTDRLRAENLKSSIKQAMESRLAREFGGTTPGQQLLPGSESLYRGPTYRSVISFVALAVPAGATVLITEEPQTSFKGEKLVCPPSRGTFTDVTQILVQNQSQTPTTGPISGETIPPDGRNTDIETRVCPPGQKIQIGATNTDIVPQDIKLSYFGDAAQQSIVTR